MTTGDERRIAGQSPVESGAFRIRALIALLVLSLSPFAGVAQSAPPVRTVYLIRHGAYLPDPKADPQAGPGLSPLGIAQARLVGARLRSIPIAFDSITSSPMTRARQTAAIVHEQISDVPATVSPLISECTPPARVELQANPAALSACKQQLDAAFAKFFTPAAGTDRNDVLVCHGNVIRYLATKALGVDPKAWIALSVAHTSVTIVQVLADGSFRVIAIGDAGHVPATLQSWGDDSDPNLVPPQTDIAAQRH
jgi:serine/threonine-protein phosphatase PGAM5